MNPAKLFDRHMRKVIADLPLVVTIDGEEYTGTASNSTNGESLIIEGIRIDQASSIAFRKRDFTTLPSPQTLITIDAIEYRIKRVDVSQCGTTFYITYENESS